MWCPLLLNNLDTVLCKSGVRVKWGPTNLGTPVPISVVIWGSLSDWGIKVCVLYAIRDNVRTNFLCKSKHNYVHAMVPTSKEYYHQRVLVIKEHICYKTTLLLRRLLWVPSILSYHLKSLACHDHMYNKVLMLASYPGFCREKGAFSVGLKRPSCAERVEIATVFAVENSDLLSKWDGCNPIVACYKMNLKGLMLLCIILWKQSTLQAIDMGKLEYWQALGKMCMFICKPLTANV